MLAGAGSIAALVALSACAPAVSAAKNTATAVPSSALDLVLLGTQGGPPVNPNRAGISSVLIVGGANYLIDCGRSSATEYAKAGLKYADLKAIFLTHLHADHIADYFNFLMLPSYKFSADNLGHVSVYGPGPAGGLPDKLGPGPTPVVSPDNPTPGLAELTRLSYAATAYTSNAFIRDSGAPDITTLSEIHEIQLPDVGATYLNTHPATAPFKVMEDDRVKVTATLVPHGPVFPSFAFRFDTDHGSVTFSGDTAKSQNLIDLAKGSDVLVHEAIQIRGANLPQAQMSHMLSSHVEVQNVGKVAQAAGVPKLVLSHIGDLAQEPLDQQKWHDWAKSGYDGEVIVGQDLQRIAVRA
jgi:ribonuclease BN (tRNA processing enzyme)